MIRPMSVPNLKEHYRSLQGEQKRQQAVAASAIHHAAHQAFPELYNMSASPARAAAAQSVTACSPITAAAEAAATAAALQAVLNPSQQPGQGAREARKRKLQLQHCLKAGNADTSAATKRAKPTTTMCDQSSGGAPSTNVAHHYSASTDAATVLRQQFDLLRQQQLMQQLGILQHMLGQSSNNIATAPAAAPAGLGSTLLHDAAAMSHAGVGAASIMHRKSPRNGTGDGNHGEVQVPPKSTARGGHDTQKTCSNCHKLITNHYQGGKKVNSGRGCPWPQCIGAGTSRCWKKNCPCYQAAM